MDLGLNMISERMCCEESAFFSENLADNHSTFPASATKTNVNKVISTDDHPIYIFSKMDECAGQVLFTVCYTKRQITALTFFCH